MTDHQVNTSSGLPVTPAAATSGGQPAGPVADVHDIAHLRPLSEGVLRAAGLHGGVDENGKVRDLRGLHVRRKPKPDGTPDPEGEHVGAVDLDPYTLPSDEAHVRKQKLEWDTQGIIERNTNADGTISLRLIHGEGDVTTAKAATDAEALDALIAKVGGTK